MLGQRSLGGVTVVVWLMWASLASAQSPERSEGHEAAQPDAADEQAAPTSESTEDDGAEPSVDARLEELRRQVGILADEVERLRSGEAEEVVLSEEQVRGLGLAPSAARTYEQRRGVSIAGYGEALFERFAEERQDGTGSGATNQFDFLRAIIYAGYRFNDRFLFNSEIEVEHADEVFVEFAYVDYLVNDALGIRGGMVLLPMGLVNEFHEPTVFFGSERPVTEQVIIPSTWRENGAGLHGASGMLSYRAYVVNGLAAEGFSASGLRGGRQKGSKAKAEDMAFTGRLDVTPTPGVFVGASVYAGGSGQGDIQSAGEPVRVLTTIVDVHGQAQIRGFDVRGLFARASIGDAAVLNRALGKAGTSGVAEQMRGGYLQLGYDVLSQSTRLGSVRLTPYYRWERVDTQARMPGGFRRDPSTDRTYKTLGVEVKPIPNVVVKLDHTWVSNSAQTGVNQFNVGLGYVF